MKKKRSKVEKKKARAQKKEKSRPQRPDQGPRFDHEAEARCSVSCIQGGATKHETSNRAVAWSRAGLEEGRNRLDGKNSRRRDRRCLFCFSSSPPAAARTANQSRHRPSLRPCSSRLDFHPRATSGSRLIAREQFGYETKLGESGSGRRKDEKERASVGDRAAAAAALTTAMEPFSLSLLASGSAPDAARRPAQDGHGGPLIIPGELGVPTEAPTQSNRTRTFCLRKEKREK